MCSGYQQAELSHGCFLSQGADDTVQTMTHHSRKRLGHTDARARMPACTSVGLWEKEKK